MRLMNVYYLIGGVALLLVTLHLHPQQAAEQPRSSFTIVAQPTNGRITFDVEGQARSDDLIGALNKQFIKSGAQTRVNVLFHQDTRLTDIFLALATVEKVGFADYHAYVYDKKRLTVTEIHFGKEQPFALAGGAPLR